MRRLLALLLSAAVFVAALPTPAGAVRHEQAQPASLQGEVRNLDTREPVPKMKVRIRELSTGEIAGITETDDKGQFAFNILKPASYLVEAVNKDDKIVGTSAISIALTPGMIAFATILIGGRHGAGFGLLWLGAIGAAAAVGITAGVTTSCDCFLSASK